MTVWEKTWSSQRPGYKLVGLTWNQLHQTVSEWWIETDDNESSEARKREDGGAREWIRARNEAQMLAHAPTTADLQHRWLVLQKPDQRQESGQAGDSEDSSTSLQSGEPQGEAESGNRLQERCKVKGKVKRKRRVRKSRAKEVAMVVE